MDLGTHSTTDAHLLIPLPAQLPNPPSAPYAVDTGAQSKSGKRIAMDQNGNYFVSKSSF